MQRLYIEGTNANGEYEIFMENTLTCHYVYAHGDLQDRARYDIVTYAPTEDFDFHSDRIEDVIAVMPDGKEIDSKLFFWHSKEASKRRDPRGIYGCHGLVVAVSDTAAMKYAESRFKRKAGFI